MNYTENYQLPQWEESDRVLREDFNDAMDTVDRRIFKFEGQFLRYDSGIYVGTSEYGIYHPNVLTFDFKPEVVLCYNRASYSTPAIFVRGETIFYMEFNDTFAKQNIIWNENSVSWYNTDDENKQLNSSNATYRYIAFGR